jgi:hypothetical protein
MAFWESKSKRAANHKADYFKCRQRRQAKNKVAWPHPEAPKLGACKTDYVKWLKLDPKAAAQVRGEGIKSISFKGDPKKAQKAKDDYLACRRKRHAGKNKAYPQEGAHGHCKTSYLKWKKYSGRPKTSEELAVEVASTTVTASRPRPTFISQAGAAHVPLRAGVPVSSVQTPVSEFVPSDLEDVATAQDVIVDEAIGSGGGSEEEPEATGFPRWMLAAGALGGLGLVWFLSGR